MHWMTETLTSLMTADRWPGMVVAIQVVLFSFCLRIAWVSLTTPLVSDHKRHPVNRAPFFLLRWGLILSFTAILLYQSTWQLGGHLRPKFVEFMQLYDKRDSNPAHQMALGRILDIKGRPLAENRLINGKNRRFYPYGEDFAHPIGHPAYTPSGLEKIALSHLVENRSDAQENWARQASDIVRNRPPSGGHDLQTTLDADLQVEASRMIGNRRGAAIALSLPEGNILLMVSKPAFNPNTVDASVFKSSKDDALLVNRCLTGMVPPGSIFKVAMAALALELGIHPIIDCPAHGYTPVDSLSPIHDYQFNYYKERGQEWLGHGPIDMPTALAESSNIYFARLLAEHIKAQAFNDLVDRFHWRDPVSLFQSSEKDGREMSIRPIKIDQARDNDPYALAQMSIGQGTLLVNPGHMLLLGVAVANQGVIVKPRIHLQDPPRNLRRVFTEDTARQLAHMMSGVVSDGTASNIQIDKLPVAGKTGSAQNPRGDSHGWFLGFAPVQNPKIIVCTLIENGGSGSSSALPVAKQILILARKLGYL